MKKYILPINKDKINFRLRYMIEGGNQLLEILEKEVEINWLRKNYRKINILDHHFLMFEYWLKNNCVVNRVKDDLNLERSILAKRWFYRGEGMLKRLFAYIDTKPTICNDGSMFQKYSFILTKFKDFKDGEGNIYRVFSNEPKLSYGYFDNKIRNLLGQKFVFKLEKGKYLYCEKYQSRENLIQISGERIIPSAVNPFS